MGRRKVRGGEAVKEGRTYRQYEEFLKGENAMTYERQEQWTPGPWHIEKGIGGELRILDQKIDRRLSGIAQLRSWPGKCTMQANAHLIAAAPDLYEALAEANAWLSRGDNKTPEQRGAKCETLGDAQMLIDSALVKARGEV
jgi:hypothetical protein